MRWIAFFSSGILLRPLHTYLRLLQVADMIAGMTDSHAVSAYRRLKGIELPG